MLKTILKNETKKTDRQNPRTNGESKAIQTKSHTEAYTYTLTKREKGKKKKKIYIYIYIYIYRCSQSLPPQFWGDFIVYSGIPQMQVHQVDCGALIRCSWGCWERFPFSSLLAQLPGFSFGFGPASACRSPEGVCSSLRQDGVKGAADSGAVAHSGRDSYCKLCLLGSNSNLISVLLSLAELPVVCPAHTWFSSPPEIWVYTQIVVPL